MLKKESGKKKKYNHVNYLVLYRAIIEMMKCQHYVRQHVRDLMETFDLEDEEERKKAAVPKVAAIASKQKMYLKKICIKVNVTLRYYIRELLNLDVQISREIRLIK